MASQIHFPINRPMWSNFLREQQKDYELEQQVRWN